MLFERNTEINVISSKSFAMSSNKLVDATSPTNTAYKKNNNDKSKTCKRPHISSPDDETKRKNAKLSASISTDEILAIFGSIHSNSDDNVRFKRLIETDTEVHTLKNNFGYTLLHMAAHCSNHEKFQILLDHDYDFNAKAKLDLTPLHLAALMANDKIVKMLIDRKVDVNCRTKYSQLTPLHLVSTTSFSSKVYYNSTAEFNLMIKLTGGVVPLYDRNESRVIEMLVESGADINARDVYWNTPLHVSTVQSDEKVIEVLLKFGAYVDVKNVDGDLPLHNVLKTFNVNALTKLLEFGADINDISEEFQGIYEYESSKANAFCNSVLEHTNKLRAADMPVDEVYKSKFHKSFWLSHRAECSREVDRLKTYFLVDKVSLYDFLQMNVRRRRGYVKYVQFDLEMKFPKYYGIVYGSCRQAEVRRSLVELAKVVWERLTEIELPDVCLEYVFMFLGNSDLTFFVAGA